MNSKPELTDLYRMTAREKRSAFSLAGIFLFRMTGLFMLLPVLALYAQDLEGATPLLVGLAIGIYGLTQALLQIPFGLLSDRFGRKPVIASGLLIFALGSVIAALADSISGVIIGRALQGAGAISAAMMALAADLTREQQRTKTMAIIGISIGASFLLAFIIGPLLGALIGVDGLFWLAVAMAAIALLILYTLVPKPLAETQHLECQTRVAALTTMLRHPTLLRLDSGILILHLTITAVFVVLPEILRDNLHLQTAQHGLLYLPVLILSVLLMGPFIGLAERQQRVKRYFNSAIGLLTLSLLLLTIAAQHLYLMAAVLVLFFAAFNYLEASLPSLISRSAPAEHRGTAMGAYSSSQFLGAFLGGITGGLVHELTGEAAAVFLLCSLMCALWLLYARLNFEPAGLKLELLPIGSRDAISAKRLQQALLAQPGIREVFVSPEQGVAYLKIDPQDCDQPSLRAFVAEFS